MPRTRSLLMARYAGWLLVGSSLIAAAIDLENGIRLEAVGIALLGVAAIGLARGRPGGGRVSSALALIVAAIGLVDVIRPTLLPLISSSPLIVTVILASGGAAFSGAAWGPRRVAHVSLGVGGLTLLAIGLTSLFVRLIGVFELYTDRGFGQLPWTLAAVAIVLGVVAIALVWSDSPDPTAYPGSVLAAVAIAGLVASALLWRALVMREVLQIEVLTANEAASTAQSIRRTIEATSRVLSQFTTFNPQPDSLAAESVLTQLLRDTPGVEYLAAIDQNGLPFATVPYTADTAAIVATVPVRAISRPSAQMPPVAVLAIPNDPNRFVIHASRCVAGACRGGVAALMTSERVLQRAAPDRRGWIYELGPAHSGARLRQHSVVTPVSIQGITWQLITSPSPATIGATRSTVPEIALILGLVSTALLTGMVRLGNHAWMHARQIERMRITTAISRATDAVWEWDVGSGVLYRSDDLLRHLGYEPRAMRRTLEEWIGLIHPDDRARVTGAFAQLGEPGHESFEAEYRVATPHGDWHAVVDRGRVVEKDDDGSVRRVMGITADVTQSRRAEQELREVEALSGMGRVAARVAHEINNPLAGIRAAFTLIKDAVPLDHPDRHYVGAIEREIERIAGVTRQLYEVYRPEQEPGESSLYTITSDAVALLEQVNRSANVEIVVDLDGVPPVVPVSGGLLRQIVYNLVQNAVDASPVGGTVDIRCRVENRTLIIAVSDQGPGVPVELRERIFEPFFTTKDSTLRTSGMGLGLTMVSRSVTAAGGELEVGDVPGGGAVFTVRLPISEGGKK
jgi:PAS domain S-box-containing protein